MFMLDEPMHRLMAYDRRRYWLENGWSLRFRVAEAAVTAGRPHGIKYAFTLHDVDGTRLLGFDNAHGLPAPRPTITGTAFGARRSWPPMTSEALTS
jgi:hypothetical protein